MKPSYITVNFQQTAAQRFPAQADTLNAAFAARLQELRAENAGASKEKQRHLENQILPGIAAYETLQKVMSPEEALATVHGYVEQRTWKGLHSVLCLRWGVGARSPAKADSERRASADGFAAKMKRTKAETGFTNPVPRFRRRKDGGKI